jgi:hypothetical protein
LGFEVCERLGLNIGHVQKVTRFFQSGNGQRVESFMIYYGSHVAGLHDGLRPVKILQEKKTALMFLEDWAWNGNVPVYDWMT